MADISEHHADLSAAVRILMDRADTDQASTISDLAKHLGQHQPNLSAKIRGRRVWALDDLYAIAEHYRIAPADLLAIMDQAREQRAAVEQITAAAAE